MKNKNKFLIVFFTALSLSVNCAYAKSINISTCEGLNERYEDLDCVDASDTGAICQPDEEIVSLPRRLQLCCCFRNSIIDDTSDGSDSTTDDPATDETSTDFGFKKK